MAERPPSPVGGSVRRHGRTRRTLADPSRAVSVPALRIAVLVAAVVLTACGTADATRPQTSLVESLCSVRDTASAEPATARDRFYNEAHRELHVLAQELTELDRQTLAARLLETKQVVEAAFDEETLPPELLADRLAALVEATTAAVTAARAPIEGC